MNTEQPHDHDHHHEHGHGVAREADRRYLMFALLLLLGFMAVEVVVGILAKSLALISDAGHMLTDVGSIALALPPLQALLHIMVHGTFEGKGLDHPEVRALFSREAMLASPWYRARLQARKDRGVAHQRRMIQEMERFLKLAEYKSVAERMDIEARLTRARERLAFVQTPEYLNLLEGTIGADPSLTAMMLQTQV